jgi:hypothetical protein
VALSQKKHPNRTPLDRLKITGVFSLVSTHVSSLLVGRENNTVPREHTVMSCRGKLVSVFETATTISRSVVMMPADEEAMAGISRAWSILVFVLFSLGACYHDEVIAQMKRLGDKQA